MMHLSRYDKAVAARIRSTRIDGGITQKALATAAGVSSQQMNKYELGQNRVSAGHLFTISGALGVPISALFGEEDGMARPLPRQERMIGALIRDFRKLDLTLQDAVLSLVRALAS